MGFVKGGATLTRYRIFEEPEAGLTDEFISERLTANAFVDIEETSEESSQGWVQFFDHLEATFPPEAFHFHPIVAFSLRLDERKLPNKILNRYMAIAEARFIAEIGKKPNAAKKRDMKDALRLDLLKRSLLDTQLFEVIWLLENNEVWLGATGERNRSIFEESWLRTFGLGLRLLVPVTVGLEVLEKPARTRLMALKEPSFFGADDE